MNTEQNIIPIFLRAFSMKLLELRELRKIHKLRELHRLALDFNSITRKNKLWWFSSIFLSP